ncbi:MAG TPA: hypothetical protein ENH78_09135 [Phycisphaerae bacterium]|nr:hypothetical protein [Phycisphaerae bacterium]
MFTHSILMPNQLQAADGDVTVDLPVNPLSVILLHISPLNETSTIGNYRLLEALLGAITNIRVSHKGAAVIEGSGTDLAVLAMLWHRLPIWQSNAVETDDDRRSIVLPILFGRRAYVGEECFPETRKGELQLTMTFDIAATGFDGLRFSVETIELMDASPTTVQKVTTLAQTFAATGQNDIDLPIGNLLRGVLLFGTTGFAGATPAPTLGNLEFLVNNLQTHYSATDFEVGRAVVGLTGVPFPPDFRHIHSGTYTTTVAGDSLEPEIGASIDDNYMLMLFDTLWNDEHSVETAGASRIHVRSNAEAANAVRALPIERVNATVFQQ